MGIFDDHSAMSRFKATSGMKRKRVGVSASTYIMAKQLEKIVDNYEFSSEKYKHIAINRVQKLEGKKLQRCAELYENDGTEKFINYLMKYTNESNL